MDRVFFLCRLTEYAAPLAYETAPGSSPIDDDPTLTQDVGQQDRRLTSVVEQDEVDGSLHVVLEAPAELSHLLQVPGGVLDQQVDIGSRSIVSGRGGPEQDRKADAVLRAQPTAEAAQEPPVLPQVALLAVGQLQFSSPAPLRPQKTLAGVAAKRALVAVESFSGLCQSATHVSRS
jgi:hypothetical protein